MSDYAPFPTAELEAIAAECDHLLTFICGRDLRTRTAKRAQVCRDAIASHAALRERCLLAELARDHGVREDNLKENPHAA